MSLKIIYLIVFTNLPGANELIGLMHNRLWQIFAHAMAACTHSVTCTKFCVHYFIRIWIWDILFSYQILIMSEKMSMDWPMDWWNRQKTCMDVYGDLKLHLFFIGIGQLPSTKSLYEIIKFQWPILLRKLAQVQLSQHYEPPLKL